MTEEQAWDEMIRAVHAWASRYMDQFETFQFKDAFGRTVYVTITHQVADPDDPKWGIPQMPQQGP